MDRGNIAEFASPADLLRDHKSKFYSVSSHISLVVQLLCD